MIKYINIHKLTGYTENTHTLFTVSGAIDNHYSKKISLSKI